jgi:ATP-dependent RNA helicase DDX60
VERFIEALVRRLCNFHLVFFSGLSSKASFLWGVMLIKLTDHEDLCIPPHNFLLKNFYLLTRSVIIRHLTCHLPKSHPEIEIHNFSSVHDPAFEEYLESIGIYFIMCHDGAHNPVKFPKKHSVLSVSDGEWQKVAFRKTIRRFISSGFNVALINGLEARDTKVRQTFQTRLMAYT